jgi:hypothetical protein
MVSFVPQLGYGTPGDVLVIGLVPLQVEKPLSRRWSVRIKPQLIAREASGSWELGIVGFALAVPWYVQERGEEWSVRGAYVGPALRYWYFPDNGDWNLFYGGELGYGWQSARGFFLILGLQAGPRHFERNPHGPQDDVIVNGVLTLGLRLN